MAIKFKRDSSTIEEVQVKAINTELDVTGIASTNVNDGITEIKGLVDNNTDKSHTHNNKSVIDAITSDSITSWNTVSNKLDSSMMPSSLPANGGTSDYSNQLTSYVFTRSNTTPIWAKVATVSIPYSMWFEYHAIAFVKGRHNSNYSQNGILAIDAVGNGTNGAVASSTAKFINASAGLDVSNFYIEKLDATSSTVGHVNLWVRIYTNPYAVWDIRVLTNSGWTFASSVTSASTLPTAGYTGAAATIENQASKLVTARTINGVSFDGRANITIADSTKAPLDSPNLSGIPTAPTATSGTNTAQVATTAFVQNSLVASGSGLPLSGGTLSGSLNIQLASGDKIASLVPEVNGQLLDFGTNFTQSGNRRTAENGALFRIDVRDGYPVFNVIWQGANATETVPFSVTKDGIVNGATFTGIAANADKLDGQDGSYYTNTQITSAKPTNQRTNDLWYEIL